MTMGVQLVATARAHNSLALIGSRLTHQQIALMAGNQLLQLKLGKLLSGCRTEHRKISDKNTLDIIATRCLSCLSKAFLGASSFHARKVKPPTSFLIGGFGIGA